MNFDEDEYRDNFLKKHRGARGAPGDLLERYAITLPATDADIGNQLKTIRAYWNKLYSGKSSIAQVARLCRTEDERLRAQHGSRMESRAWWQDQQSDRQKAAEALAGQLTDELTRRYGKLGVVPSGTLGQFADKLGLSRAQVTQAANKCGLAVVTGVNLPEAEPIRQFSALVKAMAECAARSVPELVHPGAGAFRIVERYECVGDGNKRLDLTAVLARAQDADRQRKSATVDALRAALQILSTTVRKGVNLDDVALYHAVSVAKESAGTSPEIAAAALRETGIEDRDAATIAVLVAEQGAASGPGPRNVAAMLAAGRLREAKAVAATLPQDGGESAQLSQQIADAQRRLDELLAAAKAALAVPDEALAESKLREAQLISAEDAATELAVLPPPPPAGLRATGDGTAVTLFWRRAPGHDPDTVFVVRRGTQSRPLAGPSEGDPVFRDRGDTCSDPKAPVARPVQYAVFAIREDRPPSRPASVPVTLVPPVTRLRSDVGPATVVLSWSALPGSRVEVTRTGPGREPVGVPVNGSGCQVGGLAEGQTQHFEVTAVYAGPGGQELRAVPQQVSATPRAEARPLTSLRARPIGTEDAIRVRVTWQPVDNSEIRILRCDREPEFAIGTLVSAEQMAAVGDEVTGSTVVAGRETGFETELAAGVHRLVPFSAGGTGIVIGKPVTVAVTDPVRHLSYTAFADYAVMSWEWPPNAQIAEVSWRLDDTEDVARVDRGQLRSWGGFKVPLGRGPCEVEVRAVIAVGKASFTSPPVTATISQVVETPIRYDVAKLGPALRGWSRKVTFTCDQACTGVRVRMVASSGRVMPRTPSDGETVLDAALSLRPGTPHAEKVVIPRGTAWVRCFVVAGPGTLLDPPISKLKE
jgi:hypothetical protein